MTGHYWTKLTPAKKVASEDGTFWPLRQERGLKGVAPPCEGVGTQHKVRLRKFTMVFISVGSVLFNSRNCSTYPWWKISCHASESFVFPSEKHCRLAIVTSYTIYWWSSIQLLEWVAKTVLRIKIKIVFVLRGERTTHYSDSDVLS